MFSQRWQIGLDIDSHCIRAVAVQRHRHGWQLRQCWQLPQQQPLLREGQITQNALLISALKHWRTALPKQFSLRLALPAQRILQQPMPLPDLRLREPMRHSYITHQGLKQFPLDSQTLALDYRQTHPDSTQLLLTAARQQELQQWLHCLQQADLQPEVIEIAPNALSLMAEFAGLPANSTLLHRLEQGWLWVAPRQGGFNYGTLADQNIADTQQLIELISHQSTTFTATEIYYSSAIECPTPIGAIPWSPLVAFRQLPLPLPSHPMAFVLAGGLALRREDH
ncbi:type IV pilus biogenesis protein PilM [Serratia microhaemolytica]|uniref:type IV pilus biogenesis protein PilM n=1 Tax=Serratia microhaemolytica TaxID=2675110 RepID=UPI000FDE8142|nr:pilus assembly protein PilM [Serratia microhaemolytica]